MNYLFTPSPGQAFKYYTALLILVALLIIGSFVFKNIYKKKLENRDFVFKKMYKKVPNRMIYFAIGLLFIIVVRYENIPYFAMRLWLYLLLLGMAVYAGFQVYKYFKKYPKERDNFESRQAVKTSVDVKMKYLPNKKRK
jgi:tellurite resistance protein TehA-like permease